MNLPDPPEDLISRHRLALPGPGLQERVLRAAKDAWEEIPEEVSWKMPVLRFAACLALSGLLIAAANGTAPRIVAERPPPPQRPAAVLPEMGGIYGRLSSVASVAMTDRDAIPRFLEQRRMLDDLLNEGAGERTHEG